MKLGRVLLTVAGLNLVGADAVPAQQWPTKPVRVIVTFSPGGSSDITARTIVPALQARLGQPFIVDNRPGAGATIGGGEVARAAADGHTLLLSNTAAISLSPFMLDPMPYDPMKSFTHVSYIGSVPDVVMVHPSLPARTMTDLIAWIKAQPNPVPYGSGGIGSIGHILGEIFKTEHGLRMEHVGYKGSVPMINDMLGGRLKFSFDTLPQNVAHIKAGTLIPIAVTSRARSAVAPEVPSVVELGMPKLVAENFLGVSGPAGLPEPVVARLHAAVQGALDDPAVVKRLSELGIAVRKMSSAEFTSFVRNQVTSWVPAVKASGAKLN
ncbi:MAG TPA: tripartite tricarboxylate transporter substrate binding protein [Methylomirabilota bacterium]|nr:tripartite tricarboxylate transporter substrate binding protein [Methylomirabilota bacterium]